METAPLRPSPQLFVFVAAMYELSIYRQITLYNSIFNSYLLKYYEIKITVGP
jgi:hypothetical protein